ncbi:hypothetical protein FA15DRAFT_676492 [Coprinopsis marcescibilis]|uniref:Uncharacterized protein n=1 Tax=Coprinopsis marcescibilis TaxID=230819 RepID=A0A5C3K9U8_COPMA|nr:hypothetical protein FA15DRAFT_676492 [Coprinopsis marcescibilis]
MLMPVYDVFCHPFRLNDTVGYSKSTLGGEGLDSRTFERDGRGSMYTGGYGIRAGLRYISAPPPWIGSQHQREGYREDSSGTGSCWVVERIDYNCADANGHTPLMMAAGRSRYDAVAELLELEGMKVDFRDNERMTALAHAISNGHLDSFKSLLKVDSVSAEYTTSEGLTHPMPAAHPLSAPASAIRRQRSGCTRSHSSSTCRPILVV